MRRRKRPLRAAFVVTTAAASSAVIALACSSGASNPPAPPLNTCPTSIPGSRGGCSWQSGLTCHYDASGCAVTVTCPDYAVVVSPNPVLDACPSTSPVEGATSPECLCYADGLVCDYPPADCRGQGVRVQCAFGQWGTVMPVFSSCEGGIVDGGDAG